MKAAQDLSPALAESVIEAAKTAFITSHSVALGSAGGMLLLLAVGIWFSGEDAEGVKQARWRCVYRA